VYLRFYKIKIEKAGGEIRDRKGLPELTGYGQFLFVSRRSLRKRSARRDTLTQNEHAFL